ncbi:Pkinase-domain-containing protein [Ascobolus immersus RN42]|uniref:non-specific serine/threonine protein kinase n=1 Tax=Ascobolus immersus RN42 TaxID=1160509 RepID=A0A3N4HC81_ASCIM|nr:Pkinase-domain-containing protein [Ascobolus immersus RN42]
MPAAASDGQTRPLQRQQQLREQQDQQQHQNPSHHDSSRHFNSSSPDHQVRFKDTPDEIDAERSPSKLFNHLQVHDGTATATASTDQIGATLTSPIINHNHAQKTQQDGSDLLHDRLAQQLNLADTRLHPGAAGQRRQKSAMHSPPLTPAHTQGSDKGLGMANKSRSTELLAQKMREPVTVTPQTSRSRSNGNLHSTADSSRAASPHHGVQPKIITTGPTEEPHHSPSRPLFSLGPSESLSGSAEASPVTSNNALDSAPPTPVYGRSQSHPVTPIGEDDDPYARSRRLPPTKNPSEIEPRFRFSAKKSRDNLRSSSPSGKRSHSHFSLSSLARGHANSSSTSLSSKSHSSMTELKRFFKGGRRTDNLLPPSSRPTTPASSASSTKSFKSTYSLDPPTSSLHKTYGRPLRTLGSGAGGSVRLVRHPTTSALVAIKEFRPRHTYESPRAYAKKVTAEFCIGSTLSHPNIIHTLDIVQEKGRWYEVMEYCPYDLFATVMTGKMTKDEVHCAFLQVLSGVSYLHGMGLAHRDLKLDNVVINQHGILKIIDFGSASVFRYPFENDIVEATGIVGSDPYLAPEVCDNITYDPQPADIWSLAIIFCCMSLRRFPWKAPRPSDHSFKLFSSPQTPGCPRYEKGQLVVEDENEERGGISRKNTGGLDMDEGSRNNPPPGAVSGSGQAPAIKGPWRLLRLLPRESRAVIAWMLELDPKKRASLDDVWRDAWISRVPYCREEEYEEGGEKKVRVVNGGHMHVLEGQQVQPEDAGKKEGKEKGGKEKKEKH